MRRIGRAAALFVLVLIAAACTSGPGPAPSRTPTLSPRTLLSVPGMKLAVLSAIGGHIAYCDPDEYPFRAKPPLPDAIDALPYIRKQAEVYRAILAHEQLEPGTTLTDNQMIAIHEDYKQIQPIALTYANGWYGFTVYVPKEGTSWGNVSVQGVVTRFGDVTLRSPGPGKWLSCPTCLAFGARIATPTGDVAVQDVRVGMTVWTTDLGGHRVGAVVLQIGHMGAPLGDRVVRLTLADGRRVTVSPGHPTPNGRPVGIFGPATGSTEAGSCRRSRCPTRPASPTTCCPRGRRERTSRMASCSGARCRIRSAIDPNPRQRGVRSEEVPGSVGGGG